MRLTAQEEYGLRCLLQVARQAEGATTTPEIAEREGLVRVSDDEALAVWLDEVIAAYPEEARRFASGELKLQGVLIGHVMKASKGRADPTRLNQLLGERFGR